MLKPFGHKAICIILIMLAGIGFAYGNARANPCQGSVECLICAELPHRHAAGTDVSLEYTGCRSAGQNINCGFEAGQNRDEFYGIVPAVRSFNNIYSGIIVAGFDHNGQFRFPKAPISQFLLSASGEIIPTYLSNQSLLC